MIAPGRRQVADLRLAAAGVLMTVLCTLATGFAAIDRAGRELFLRIDLGRRIPLPTIAMAMLAATARIYPGAYTPLDVLGGAAPGSR
ncbi:hypothetical protein AB0L63_29810 [Nocardia sp. NPDC051990]|uniref:hypothetical protein n=1 Tax=Nocardia sp. NPDC051990 TaxID=3155285 RepID=UPI003418B92F